MRTETKKSNLLLIGVALLGCAAQLSAQSDVYVYPAGCFDRYGRPLNADPSNPSNSADPACQPPQSGAVVRGTRPGAAPAAGSPSMESGSINLPPTPVPVPGGIGVMNP